MGAVTFLYCYCVTFGAVTVLYCYCVTVGAVTVLYRNFVIILYCTLLLYCSVTVLQWASQHSTLMELDGQEMIGENNTGGRVGSWELCVSGLKILYKNLGSVKKE